MEIDANGTTTIGGDLFNDSGSRTTANPVGLVVNMEALNTYKDEPQKEWIEYTVLWSGLGEQLKHLGFDLIKITGAEI